MSRDRALYKFVCVAIGLWLVLVLPLLSPLSTPDVSRRGVVVAQSEIPGTQDGNAVGEQSESVASPLANGDFVHKTTFSTPCGPRRDGSSLLVGVGLAFDGEYLWYSCFNTATDLYKANALTGQVVASYNIAGGLGALAWDGKRKKLWAAWGEGSGAAQGAIRLIDPTNGSATIAFTASAAINSSGIGDGLAYDAQDDSLYISADIGTTIFRYSTAGTLLDSFTWTGTGCFNSGLAIGGDLLFQGANGCNRVWVINKATRAAAFNFPTNVTNDSNFRDEDLECDSVTFSPRTVMWSVEAYEPRRAVAFEIPPGSCGTGGGVDSDADGLLDEWEINGVTIDPDGSGPTPPQFIALHQMGADKDKPDIFIHLDWMQDAANNQALNTNAIRAVVQSFANSPYASPTGSIGINLHVDQGPNSILNFATNATWGALSRAQAIPWAPLLGSFTLGNYDWTAFQALKDQFFTPTGRTPIFRYVIAADNYSPSGSSGISRGISASDFIVSLGSFTNGTGSVNEQAGTFMHELGHNLNLRHGGGDNTNFKPNYLSIMNYSFQLQGLIQNGTAGNFDYSRNALTSLVENNLSEPAGLGAGSAGFGTRRYCATTGTFVVVNNANAAIDWNCNGNNTETGVTYDINNGGGASQTLVGFGDWANLKLKGGAIGLAGVAPTLPITTEPELLTPALADTIQPFIAPVNLPLILNSSRP